MAAQKRQMIRLGARGSTLAQTQAKHIQHRLAKKMGLGADEIAPHLPVHIIKTSGDRIKGNLAPHGGKGLFVKELQQALLDGEIDLAIHSAKDHPVQPCPGLYVCAFDARKDPRDAYILAKNSARITPAALDENPLKELPEGFRLGTASPRRKAQALRSNPGLELKLCRGNIRTRLAKLDAGEFDGLILALAGLERLELHDRASKILSIEAFPPCAGQGAVLLETRADDIVARDWIERLNHTQTFIEMTCERALISASGGSCQTAVGAVAIWGDKQLSVIAQGLSSSGDKSWKTTRDLPLPRPKNLAEYAPPSDLETLRQQAEKFGAAIGNQMRKEAGHYLELET